MMAFRYKSNSGLTLLELMIATAVLVVAIAGLLATFAGLFSLNENTRKLTLAATACQDKLEEIRNSSFAALYTLYNNTAFEPDGFAASDAEGTVYIDNTDPDLLEVAVSVSWRGRSNKIVGEDANLNGALDTGEDTNGDERLSSPAEIVTLIGQR
ncbi:MAG: prepilin-type N-terminal cleavage/methylation domain-containing protein [Candidatus Omnitrophica bacterium]|nr:prepilin-type N-terminal cleavage/methylation domain-containing protein [Candidatus Omnitrophota bacterium]